MNVNGVGRRPRAACSSRAPARSRAPASSLHPQLRAPRRAPVRRRRGRLQPRHHRGHRRDRVLRVVRRHRARGDQPRSTTATCAATATTASPRALVVEPQHATYHDPVTGAPVRSGTIADIRVPGQEDFRETTLVYQDGLDLRMPTGAQVPDKQLSTRPDGGRRGRPDGGTSRRRRRDAGEKGVNYTNAPLHRRLGAAPGVLRHLRHQRRVGEGAVVRDPTATRARRSPASYAGDQLRVRVLGGEPAAPDAASSSTAPPGGGAVRHRDLARRRPGRHRHRQGGQRARPADRGRRPPVVDTRRRNGLPDGMWGLARVYPQPADCGRLHPDRVAAPDNPFAAGNAPLQPLERTLACRSTSSTDTDGDGVRDAGETAAARVPVRLLTTDGDAAARPRPPAPTGRAVLAAARARTTSRSPRPPGRRSSATPRRRVDLTEDGAPRARARPVAGSTAPAVHGGRLRGPRRRRRPRRRRARRRAAGRSRSTAAPPSRRGTTGDRRHGDLRRRARAAAGRRRLRAALRLADHDRPARRPDRRRRRPSRWRSASPASPA